MRPDDEVDAVADRGVAGPADPGDPPVLDPDVGLDDADRRGRRRSRRRRPRRARRARPRPAWAMPEPDVLGVAPDRLVARAPGGPPRRGSRGSCRRAGSDRRRRAEAPPLRRGEAAHASCPRAPPSRRSGRASPAGLAGTPALGRAGLEVRRKPSAAARSNSSRAVHAIEREVRGDPERPAARCSGP